MRDIGQNIDKRRPRARPHPDRRNRTVRSVGIGNDAARGIGDRRHEIAVDIGIIARVVARADPARRRRQIAMRVPGERRRTAELLNVHEKSLNQTYFRTLE